MEHGRLRRTMHIALMIALCSMTLLASKATADTTTTTNVDVAAAPPAGSPPTPVASGKVHNFPPSSAHNTSYTVSDLQNGNSPNPPVVMPTSRVHLFFWSPTGKVAYPSNYIPAIVRYFKDVVAAEPGHTNVYSAAIQYGAKYKVSLPALCHGRTCAKAWVLTDAYPTNCSPAGSYTACVTQVDLQNEIEAARTNLFHFHTGLNDISFVFLPPTTDTCDSGGCFSTPAFCAYHSAYFPGPSPVVYSNMPYVPGVFGCDVQQYPNGSLATTPADAEFSPLSHEHNEAITDPIPGTGWFNGDLSHENGDQCAYVFDDANADGFSYSPDPGTGTMQGTFGRFWNQKINKHKYLLQEEWSNHSFDTTSGPQVGCVRHG